MKLKLQPGSRCLLIGANGAGKTTLLKILGGKHMIPKNEVLVLGRPPFHDTVLTTSGNLSYVGGNWTRDIAFAGNSIPLTVRGEYIPITNYQMALSKQGAGGGSATHKEPT